MKIGIYPVEYYRVQLLDFVQGSFHRDNISFESYIRSRVATDSRARGGVTRYFKGGGVKTEHIAGGTTGDARVKSGGTRFADLEHGVRYEVGRGRYSKCLVCGTVTYRPSIAITSKLEVGITCASRIAYGGETSVLDTKESGDHRCGGGGSDSEECRAIGHCSRVDRESGER